MIETARRWTSRLLPIVLLGLAGWVLWREFRNLSPAVVMAEIQAWGAWRIAAASALTIFSFGLLAAMDWMGLLWAGAKVPLRVVLLGAFCANAFAHAVGFSLLTGSAVRARLYNPHGASLMQIAQTSLFAGVSFGLGIVTLAGLSLLVSPSIGSFGADLSPGLIRWLAMLLLATPVVYIAACLWLRGQVTLLGRLYSLPPPGYALAQIALGLVDNAVTAMVIWVLLPTGFVGAAAFANTYVVGAIVGVISHVPGGAGVFEGVVLTLLPNLSRPTLAAAFVGFRLIYYIAPLVLAGALLVRSGLKARKPLPANAPPSGPVQG